MESGGCRAAMATPFSPLALSPIPNPKLGFSKLSFAPNLKSPIGKPSRSNFPNSINPRRTAIWRRFSSASSQFLLAEATSIDESAEIVPPSADVSSTIISGLLFIAFIGLSILTVGVIYIAVTDFLQKREKDRFEKEEAAANRKKKRGRKGVGASRTRGGPRGFGQKLAEDEEDDNGAKKAP
ncbi:uncharacterized protein LOC127262993 [Andrographis paniculata]|uniref:uncharacterized protein LOC127262993 n=1 Tax=Andrographis paniculata TaxID=175694 RepID=UPI0021E935A3|nr:uncharacterized protein LOC127262993 [Andrographis paniculata]